MMRVKGWRHFRRDRRGSAGIEFGIIAPVLGLILGGAVDLGGVVFVKFRLDNAVSAGANYALVRAADVSSENGQGLAGTIAAIIASSGAGEALTGTITVNNGPVVAMAGGATTVTGTPANADSCYCPTRSGATLSWGSTYACGAACPGGGQAGKFVAIETSRTYSPLFANYGIVDGGSIGARAVVRVQ